MLPSFRSALLVAAALSASSVAPAQVGPASLPMSADPLAALPEAVPAMMREVPDSSDSQSLDVQSPDSDSDSTQAEAVKPSGDLSSLVAQLRSSQPGTRELECLATGIYFESKSEPLAGQLAVGEVIANRANSNGRFPSSYCGVLFQRSQFSFIRGHGLPSVPRSSRQWQTAVAIASIVDQDLKNSDAPKALFFHARSVSPGWKLKRVASIGNHVFYR
jgi:spore germination cell wall hydrolase CwlJ-like protein